MIDYIKSPTYLQLVLRVYDTHKLDIIPSQNNHSMRILAMSNIIHSQKLY